MEQPEHKRRIVPPTAPEDPNVPIFTLQLLSSGEYVVNAPGMSPANCMQIMFGAITQYLFASFQERERPLIQPPPLGMKIPENHG